MTENEREQSNESRGIPLVLTGGFLSIIGLLTAAVHENWFGLQDAFNAGVVIFRNLTN